MGRLCRHVRRHVCGHSGCADLGDLAAKNSGVAGSQPGSDELDPDRLPCRPCRGHSADRAFDAHSADALPVCLSLGAVGACLGRLCGLWQFWRADVHRRPDCRRLDRADLLLALAVLGQRPSLAAGNQCGVKQSAKGTAPVQSAAVGRPCGHPFAGEDPCRTGNGHETGARARLGFKPCHGVAGAFGDERGGFRATQPDEASARR